MRGPDNSHIQTLAYQRCAPAERSLPRLRLHRSSKIQVMMTLVQAPQARSTSNGNSRCDTDAAMGIRDFASAVGAKSATLRPSAVKQTLQVHFVDGQGNTLTMNREGLRALPIVATPGPSLAERISSAKKGETVSLADTLVAPIRDEFGRVTGFSLFLQGEVQYGEVVAEVTF